MAAEEEDKPSEVEALPSGVSARVFISYASQDIATAEQICRYLESHRIGCWMAPRDVRPGAPYADAIVRAINEAKAIVLVLSANAAGSAHVAREVERAASKRKPIIPFRLDEAVLNPELEYFLSNSQWIEVPRLGTTAALSKLHEAVAGGALIPPASHPRVDRTAKRFSIVLAVLVSIGIGGIAGWRYWTANRTPGDAGNVAMADRSIAVLPFADMSEKKDQEYFGDGMAEEIIDLLAKVPSLKIIGRTSSFQFKGKTQDLRSIGTQLGVTYVLEGSVRKSGDRVRVTAQLIDSRNNTHRWSETYDRDFSDVLKLQGEIALKVAREVEGEAFLSDFFSRRSLANPEAYTAFLHGAKAKDKEDQQGLEQALSDFQRALDLDPTFADAAAVLADTYVDLGSLGFMPRAEALEKGRRAAELALKLDPHLPRAHAELGFIYLFYDWNWPAAGREFKLAGFEPPQLSMSMGRPDDALKVLETALARDPLDPTNRFWLGLTQLRRGRLPEAEAALRRTVELSPEYTFAHYDLALVLLARNEPDAAMVEMQKEPSELARLVGTALINFRLGHKTVSDAALAQYITSYGPFSPSGAASVYAYRGESDEAFKWLERAYDQRDPLVSGIKYRTEFDRLHEDPRYAAFMRKMKLPE